MFNDPIPNRFLLFCAAFSASLAAQAFSSPELQLDRIDDTLVLRLERLDKGSPIEIRIHSDRNARISKRSDISSLTPAAQAPIPVLTEFFYPIVDVAPEADGFGVAKFAPGDSGVCSVNAIDHRLLLQVVPELRIENDQLVHWENYIGTEDGVHLQDFYVAFRFTPDGERYQRSFALLSPSWSGRVSVHSVEAGKTERFAEQVVPKQMARSRPQTPLAGYKRQGISKDRLVASLEASLRFTLRLEDKTPGSPTEGGLYLFYDYEEETFRRPFWVWSWGPSIKLLIDSSHLPDIAERLPKSQLLALAESVGSLSRSFQSHNPDDSTYGIPTSRWRQVGQEVGYSITENYGLEEFHSVADALFLMGWGWIPLYEETGDAEILADARLLSESTQALLDTFEILPMDYINSRGKWKDYTINEAGFGPEGFAPLFAATGDTSIKATGELYIQRLLKRFEQEDGLWAKRYNFLDSSTVPSQRHTRGQGWAMEGLIASYTMTQDDAYKEKAIRLAEHLMAGQHPDGCWEYAFDQPVSDVGIAEKGTALWCHLFYRLYHITGNPEHLATARRALNWCLENQYTGPDEDGFGGLPGANFQSGVTYRPWFPLACSYSTAFFGLAVIEELKLIEQ